VRIQQARDELRAAYSTALRFFFQQARDFREKTAALARALDEAQIEGVVLRRAMDSLSGLDDEERLFLALAQLYPPGTHITVERGQGHA
jgi:hypothetical protein